MGLESATEGDADTVVGGNPGGRDCRDAVEWQ